MSKLIIGSEAYTSALHSNVRYSDAHGPDVKDLHDVRTELFGDSKMNRMARELTADRPSAEAHLSRGLAGGALRRGSAGGMCSTTAAPTARNRRQANGSAAAFRTLDGCDTSLPLCDADLLGFVTVPNGADTVPGFPVAGAAGAISQGTAEVAVGTGIEYRASYYFWELRDANNGFVPVPGLLVQAQIGAEQQILPQTAREGIVSSVFALTSTPLQIGWAAWSTLPSQNLQLTFGNFLGAGVDVHAFNVWWGNSQRLNGNGGTDKSRG